MKVLVTGAGGYIGRHVVKYLLDDNMEVIANDFNDESLLLFQLAHQVVSEVHSPM